MIRASLTGRLGGDPAERQTRAGGTMATVSITVDAARDGVEPVTEWIGLVGVGADGDALLRCRKGDVVTAIRRLTKSVFAARDGETRSNWSLLVEQIVSARDRPASVRSRQPPPELTAPRPANAGELPSDQAADLYRGDQWGEP